MRLRDKVAVITGAASGMGKATALRFLAEGVFLGIKHAARIMQAQGRGAAIINTSSIAGLSGDAGPVAYSAAKAAVINLTRAAAVELAPERIRVNAICPGFIATPLAEQGRPGATRREFAKS